MSKQKQPLLSIGMIFKNEIRCLERCMKSLQPLRDAVPCELVMADTGSDDGSREIAERYADILIDFPWIDDFSAARNAVVERCSGEWYFSIDADEWLDEDVSEVIRFFKTPKLRKDFRACAIMMYNYRSADFNSDRSDFMAVRFMRTYPGMRYIGAIHEHWEENPPEAYGFGKTILHHDGYVDFSEEQGKAKRERNMQLLYKKLEDDPKDILTLIQCIESTVGAEQEDFIRRALAGIEEKWPKWEQFGPTVYRYAVSEAKAEKLPELWTWIDRARELFPKSMLIRVDVSYVAFVDYFDCQKWTEAIAEGEAYLSALQDYYAWKYDPAELMFGTLTNLSKGTEHAVRTLLASACLSDKRYGQAWDMLQTVKPEFLNRGSIRNYVGMLFNLYAQSDVNTDSCIQSIWERLGEVPDWKTELLSVGAEVLTKQFREKEKAYGYRHAFQVLLPLVDQCELGRAAKVLSLEDPQEIEAVLNRVEDWNQFSIYALVHALEHGARFPLPGKALTLEEMDRLADRIAHAGNEILELNERAEAMELEKDVQALCWARALALSVLEVFPWKKVEGENIGRGLTAAQVFVHVERVFLPLCYAPEALRAERLFLLPPMHRFGWHMIRAFNALEAGDKAGYVRLLREGLSANENMRAMVEFLLEHTPELAPPPPPAELLALADQVRTLLAMYPADDPAVEALKAGEAYRKVAHLIEGVQAPMFGGLKQ